jgi:hypothetical protein
MHLYFLFNIENIFISFIKEKRSLLLLAEIFFP